MRYMHHRANNLLLCGKSSDADIQEEHKRLGMRPAGLTLEITEGAAIADPAYIAELPRRLPDVRLSIADFGVGHSSLVNLGRLPFAEVKIDRSFVTGCEASREDLAVVRSVVDLAHALGVRAVAEGIETAEQQRQFSASAAISPKVSISPDRCRPRTSSTGARRGIERRGVRPERPSNLPSFIPTCMGPVVSGRGKHAVVDFLKSGFGSSSEAIG